MTENTSRLPKRVLAAGAAEVADVVIPPRPRTRADCVDGPRPCPWAGCKYHLAIDVNENTGNIKHNYPDIEPGDWPNSCALDVADHGPQILEVVAELMNVTRQRVQQLELRAKRRLRILRGTRLRQLLDDSLEREVEDRIEHTEDFAPGRMISLYAGEGVEARKRFDEKHGTKLNIWGGKTKREAEARA